jgi:hypothetical protein
MSLRSRGQESSVFLVVDGALQQGSFTKVTDWSITPRADLTDSPFLGESTDDPDLMHHGFDFKFSCHAMDNLAFSLWDQIVSAQVAGVPMPKISVVFVTKYRDPGVNPVSITMQDCRLKMDSHDVASRKDYIKTSFSGKCRTKRTR